MSTEEQGFVLPVTPLLALCILLGAMGTGFLGGASFVLIFLAAVALSLTISLIWGSLSRLGQGAILGFEDAMELAAPTATEEQKLAVLRALKDLEYELSVGKISKEDFDLASNEYRAQARLLIAVQDESMKSQLKSAEIRVAEHLFKHSHLISQPDHSTPDYTSPDYTAQESKEGPS
jgi:hypothetical protein